MKLYTGIVILFGILLFLLPILFISFVSGAEIGITPASIELRADPNVQTCRELTLLSNLLQIVDGEDKWSDSGEGVKNLNSYNKKASEYYINVTYPKEVVFNGKERIKVCMTGRYPGVYHGAIIYSIREGGAGVGTWITFTVPGVNDNIISLERSEENKTLINLISGNIISNTESKEPLPFLLLTLLLIIILIYLYKRYKRLQQDI